MDWEKRWARSLSSVWISRQLNVLRSVIPEYCMATGIESWVGVKSRVNRTMSANQTSWALFIRFTLCFIFANKSGDRMRTRVAVYALTRGYEWRFAYRYLALIARTLSLRVILLPRLFKHRISWMIFHEGNISSRRQMKRSEPISPSWMRATGTYLKNIWEDFNSIARHSQMNRKTFFHRLDEKSRAIILLK